MIADAPTPPMILDYPPVSTTDVLSTDTAITRQLCDGDSSRRSHQTRVGFHTVEIYEHPIILGDNPSVVDGPALAIDWESMGSRTHDFEEYERLRSGLRRQQRRLKLTATAREEILVQQGYSVCEIDEGIKAVGMARQQRRLTNDYYRQDPFNERMEIVKRRCKTALTFGYLKRRERKWLQTWCNINPSTSKIVAPYVKSSKPKVSTSVPDRTPLDQADHVDSHETMPCAGGSMKIGSIHSIMLVRTLEESLSNSDLVSLKQATENIVDAQEVNLKLRLRCHSLTASTSSSCDDDDDVGSDQCDAVVAL